MKKVHEMHVKEVYYDLLRNGKKKVELRLLDQKRCAIKIGDNVVFSCNSCDQESIQFDVSDIITSESFLSLLKVIPESYLGGVSASSQLNDLKEFYSPSDERKFGVVAIVFESKSNE